MAKLAFAPATLAAALAVLPAAAATRPVHVWFVRGERGVIVHRLGSPSAPVTTAVRALLRGPTAAERRRGLTTAVPAGTRLLGATVRGTIAVVDLSGRFASGGGTLSMSLRLGQLVYTVTSVPRVTGLVLRLNGTTARVLGGEGLILDQPLTRASAKGFAP